VFGGNRAAGLSGNEQMASNLAQQDNYSGMLDRSSQAYGSLGDIAGQSSVSNLDQYINPYTKNVLDIANKELGRSYDQQMTDLRGTAASRGAFGGSRQAILEGAAQRNFLEKQKDLYAQGMADAYDRAVSARGTDLGREFQGALAQGQGFSNLGQQYAGMTNDQIRALMATGETERGIEQMGLDANYQEFLRQQGQSREDLDRYLGSLGAGDYTRTGTGSTRSSGMSLGLG